MTLLKTHHSSFNVFSWCVAVPGGCLVDGGMHMMKLFSSARLGMGISGQFETFCESR